MSAHDAIALVHDPFSKLGSRVIWRVRGKARRDVSSSFRSSLPARE